VMLQMSAIPGVWHAARAARAIAGAVRRRSPRGIVLLYHRVAGPRRDPQWLDVSPRNFDAQLSQLARTSTVLRLDEFETRRRAGTLPSRAVAITFDDGYADNLLAAAPLLERYDMPATFFVTAGMIGTDREFWWDDAERIAFSPRALAAPVPGISVVWTTDDGAPPAVGSATAPDDWTIAKAMDPTPRHRLYRALCNALRPLPASEQELKLRALREWAGVPVVARPAYRALSVEELRALGARPRLSIGAHTMTHPVLSLLPAAAQRDELMRSRTVLEGHLASAVPIAAYPYGTRGDVSQETVSAARAAGFDFAMANEPGAAWRWSSRWRVPRQLVRDWDATTFAAQLDAWFAS
jgi:peptidoglycan/xylan/chitin deacetylase (PgdA/CDA1 family)